MRFQVLGPLRVTLDGRDLDLGSREQRRVLALLLASPGGLSAERLVDELTGSAPPRSARHMIEVYVSRLRRVLDEAVVPRIPRCDGRYTLEVAPGELDAERIVERAAEAASALDTDPAAARQRLTALEALWRGAPYDGLVDDAPLLQAEIERLEQCRMRIVVDRLAADLALGRHAEVLGELEALTHEHPYIEPLWQHRILALYRCGRAADALLVAAELRRRLDDELGVEPSPAVRRLEARILRQDPTLDCVRRGTRACRRRRGRSPIGLVHWPT